MVWNDSINQFAQRVIGLSNLIDQIINNFWVFLFLRISENDNAPINQTKEGLVPFYLFGIPMQLHCVY